MKLSKIKFIKLYYLLTLSLVSFNLVVFPQPYDPVLLDPGHGDTHGGTTGSCGLIEKTFVLDISNEVYDLIENDFNCPWEAFTTRHTDIFLTPEQRVEMANNPNDNQIDSHGYNMPMNGVVLFVSIHANCCGNAQGTEVFYYESEDERARRSKNVAVLNLQYYLDRTRTVFSDASSRGIKDDTQAFLDSIYVLRNTIMPAVLVETEFITNFNNCFYFDQTYKDLGAEGIKQAICWTRASETAYVNLEMTGNISAGANYVDIDETFLARNTTPRQAIDYYVENSGTSLNINFGSLGVIDDFVRVEARNGGFIWIGLGSTVLIGEGGEIIPGFGSTLTDNGGYISFLGPGACIGIKEGGTYILDNNVSRTFDNDGIFAIFGENATVRLNKASELIIGESGILMFLANPTFVFGMPTPKIKISGKVIVADNVNLVFPAGADITIYPGAEFEMGENSSITIEGNFQAIGDPSNKITFNRSGNNNWYGIIINSSSGSSANITYAEIKNANYGLVINNASPSITSTKINYCGTGILITSGAAPKFRNNTITYNDYNGVQCIAGVTASFGTFPTWGDNVIRRNGNLGIYAAYSSTVFLGKYTLPPTGGRNSIYENYNTNGYQISIRYGSTSLAEKNWWGSDPPDPNIFNSSSGNDIDYDPWWYGSDPHAGRSLTKSSDNGYNPDTSPVVSGLDNLREKLWKAFIFYQKAEYDSALQIGKGILTTSPASKEALSALNILRLAYNESGKLGFQDYITSLIAQHSGKELAGVARLNLAYYLAKQGDFVAALDQLKINVNAFPNSPLERISLFQKAVFFLLELEDRKSAEAVLAELERKYPDDPLVVETQRLLGQSIQQYKPQKQAEPSDTIDFALIANYPNPFNPTTTIEYSIPKASFVELKIYDILGGEVASLVKENKPSGKHSVKFNASNLPSGIYFYRIVSGNFTATKKLIILK